MELERLTTCILFILVFYGSPGPATLSLAASGASVGFRRSLPYLFGIVSGLLVNFVVAALGITVLMQRAPALVTIMTYLSLGYIIYLAVRMVRTDPKAGAERPLVFSQGVLLNMLNPKAYFASLAVFSQFGTGTLNGSLLLMFLIATIGLAVDFAWCYFGSLLGLASTSSRRLRWLRITMATLLVASTLFATFS